jgi:magnesium-transporting ATPase (P-type)
MIPISLYVSIEVLKLGLAMLINNDLQLFDRPSQTFAICRNSDLIEELGQVEIVFSDKTGTLTQNKMAFKKCSVGLTTKYGQPRSGESPAGGMCKSGIEEIREALSREASLECHSVYERQTLTFFKALSLCHSVQIQTSKIRG